MKIKFLIIFTFYALLYHCARAQNTYYVTYKLNAYDTEVTMPFTINGSKHTFVNRIPQRTYHLIFNDSLAYAFSTQKGGYKNPYSKSDTLFGLKAGHHDRFYNIKLNKQYHVVAHPNKKKKRLIEETLVKTYFVIVEDSIIVSNNLCSRGYVVVGVADTLHAIISKNIKSNIGPMGYQGLPGLIIESFRTKSGQYIKLDQITKSENYRIVIPDLPLITWEDYKNGIAK
ncbi:MAG: hypothetical protein EOP47_28945 [Sphingobacteriaceae bacterium]|nr:MAG: hypothetical protein EOP47_28945 [Sphingobacteriaceae bacterium]